MTINTGYVSGVLGGLTNKAEDAIKTFITNHTGTVDANGDFTVNAAGTLILSAAQSLELQRLMAEQSVAANLATSTLRSIKDSIVASARNIN